MCRKEIDDAVLNLKELDIDPLDFETAEEYFREVDVCCAFDRDGMSQENFDRIYRPACTRYWKLRRKKDGTMKSQNIVEKKVKRFLEVCSAIANFNKDTEQTRDDFKNQMGFPESYQEYLERIPVTEYDSFNDLVGELKELTPWVRGRVTKVKMTIEFEQFIPEGEAPDIDIYSTYDKSELSFTNLNTEEDR